MRCMILRKADAATEAGVPPGRELLDAMGEYMGSLAKAGVLLAETASSRARTACG